MQFSVVNMIKRSRVLKKLKTCCKLLTTWCGLTSLEFILRLCVNEDTIRKKANADICMNKKKSQYCGFHTHSKRIAVNVLEFTKLATINIRQLQNRANARC